ncbi:hypothetical protein LARI1_G003279 [Lachnellula arida]|uniref:Uncharacterized protein n=1 Tax=Lachnellula arida TaxID=1316785 RepID=A0A8T9BG57_9HELO|nr:hypothetical protein LARI1_G003279 [Lachnellula arida]
MAHHHLSKRPYNGSQPPITSYFSSPTPSLSTTTTGPSPSHRAPSTPPLPHDIQANLLSVGMRVRKAVPEGYKTGSGAYSAFTLFSDDNSSSHLPLPEKRYAGGSGSRSAGNRPRARELTPFCGILKVGGMAQQQQQQQWGIYAPNHRAEEEEEGEDEEECPVLGQGSTVSNDNGYYGGYTGNGGNKRRFEEDDQGDERMNLGLGLGLGAGRLMAVPVPRRKKMGVDNRGKMVFGRGQENVAVVGADGDFGEADFLDYSAALGEVEMGGV